MVHKFLPMITVAVLLVLVFAGLQISGRNQQNLHHAPDFVLEDFEGGESISLADFRGKPVVLNFWAKWCPFCLKELGDFKEVAAPYGDDLVILAVNRAEPRETIAEYANEIGLAGTNMKFLLDPDDRVYRLFDSVGMPVTYFIDARGQIVDRKSGPLTPEEMAEKIQKLMQ